MAGQDVPGRGGSPAYLGVPVADPVTTDALAAIAKAGNQYCYQIAMVAAGAAGVLFCRVLWTARLAPVFLAVWGVIGYAALLAGAALEILGYPVGLAFSVPGGLFEVAFGVLLLAKGWRPGLTRRD